MSERPVSVGLSHVAMSVPVGTLTDAFRTDLLAFWGEHLGWSEIEVLRRPDRLTLAVGDRQYLNVRELDGAVAYGGYEHFGVLLPTPEAVEIAWTAIVADRRVTDREEIVRGPGGYRQFSVRYLLPMRVEVQHLPAGFGAA
ncbi:MAG: VOC family protein [Acidimicrobiia bacterium]